MRLKVHLSQFLIKHLHTLTTFIEKMIAQVKSFVNIYKICYYFTMRLTTNEINVLKNKLHLLSDEAKIFLFGSRTDDNKKGGDIDLLIVSEKLTKKDIRKLRLDFFDHFGEQKLDIVLDNGNFSSPFTKIIYNKAIQL